MAQNNELLADCKNCEDYDLCKLLDIVTKEICPAYRKHYNRVNHIITIKDAIKALQLHSQRH